MRFLIKRRRRAADRVRRHTRARTNHARLAALPLVCGVSPAAAQRSTLDTLAAIRRLKDNIRGSSPGLTARRAAVAAAEARLRVVGLAAWASLAAELEEVPSGVNVACAHSMRVDVAKEFLPPGLRASRGALAQRDVDRARRSSISLSACGALVSIALSCTSWPAQPLRGDWAPRIRCSARRKRESARLRCGATRLPLELLSAQME